MPRTGIRKLLLTLLSVLIGWASGFVFYAAYSILFTSWGRPTDVDSILFWTGVFSLASWLLFVVPVALSLSSSSLLLHHLLASVFGAAAGLIAFLVLVGWWTGFWTEPLYLGDALVIGGATGWAYSAFHRSLGQAGALG